MGEDWIGVETTIGAVGSLPLGTVPSEGLLVVDRVGVLALLCTVQIEELEIVKGVGVFES